MIGIIVIAIIIIIPLFSCAKSAGIADQRLEEFHDALILKMEDSAYEGQGEI